MIESKEFIGMCNWLEGWLSQGEPDRRLSLVNNLEEAGISLIKDFCRKNSYSQSQEIIKKLNLVELTLGSPTDWDCYQGNEQAYECLGGLYLQASEHAKGLTDLAAELLAAIELSEQAQPTTAADNEQDDDIISSPKACKEFGTSIATIRRAKDDGNIKDYRKPGYKQNDPILVSRKELKSYLDKSRNKPKKRKK